MAKAGRKGGSYVQGTRLLRVIDLLAAHRQGMAVMELAHAFHLSERQMRRDLDAIVETGRVVERVEIDGRPGARLADPKVVPLHLTLGERYALLAVRRVFDVLKDTPFHDEVRTICDKIAASLPAEHQRDLEAFGERIACLPDGGTKIYRGKDEVIDQLRTGIVRRLRVRYRYRSKAGRISKGVLEPYAMVLYKQGLYIIGRPVGPEGQRSLGLTGTAERTFAVERFSQAKFLKGTSFDLPDSFRIDGYFQGAFGIYRADSPPEHVVIDFRESARELVEARDWHPSQRLTPIKGGGVRLEIDVSDLTQVVQWVIGWGPLARAQQPPALVARVGREHREASALYDVDPG